MRMHKGLHLRYGFICFMFIEPDSLATSFQHEVRQIPRVREATERSPYVGPAHKCSELLHDMPLLVLFDGHLSSVNHLG